MTAKGDKGREPAPAAGAGWARPIVRENLNETAYRAVRAALTEGRLQPGQALTLRPLSAQFGISVTPMREALLRLVSERALSLDARGTVIVPTLTRDEVEEIGELRAELEGRGAAKAARAATSTDIERLTSVHDELTLVHKAGDYSEAVRVNTRFHLELCRIARSPILFEIVEGLWVRCGPMLWHTVDERTPKWTPGPHLEVLSALRAGDAAAARHAIVEDVERWVRGYIVFAADPTADPD